MKKTIAILFTLSAVLVLSSFMKSNMAESVVAEYIGHYEDEDDGTVYYSFESEDDYLEFSNIKEDLIKKYSLNTEEYTGKTFNVEYTRDEDTDALIMTNLELK